MSPDATSLLDDVDLLKAMLVAAGAELEQLRMQVARLRRMAFGRSSERLTREADQLELGLEESEAEAAASLAPAVARMRDAAKPYRQPLPDHLPREDVVHEGPCVCPDCGGAMRRLCEDVTEQPDYVPASFRVVRHVRPRLSCRSCPSNVAGSVPDCSRTCWCPSTPTISRSTVRRASTPGTASTSPAPPWRTGSGARPDCSTRWSMRSSATSGRHHAARRRHARAGARARRRSHQDRQALGLCARRARGRRRGATRRTVPLRARPHADGYAGLDRLYGEQIAEVACWAHVRRKFFDVHAATGSAIAREALDHIAGLYAVEHDVRGRPPDERRRERQARAGPLLDAFRQWLDVTGPKLARRSDLAVAVRYALTRWPALTRYAGDGRLEIDNNAAERALRGIAVGRKNWLFAGSDQGGHRAASIYSLVETAKLDGVDPEAWLTDTIARIADHPARRIVDLLPWNYQPA